MLLPMYQRHNVARPNSMGNQQPCRRAQPHGEFTIAEALLPVDQGESMRLDPGE